MTALTESIRSRRQDKRSQLAILWQQLEAGLGRLNQLNVELIENEKEMEKDFRTWVKKGAEKGELAESLPIILDETEAALERTRENIKNDYLTVETKTILSARLSETLAFLAWLRELSELISRAGPRFDEAKLSPLPEGEDHGFISSQKVREVLKSKS